MPLLWQYFSRLPQSLLDEMDVTFDAMSRRAFVVAEER
jgi:hypothetical protein